MLPDRAESTLNLDLDAVPIKRTLGLRWDYIRDHFGLSVKPSDVSSYTKRTFLRIVSSIFYPLGFLAVIVFPAKIPLQDLWRTSLGWDDPIP